MTIVASCWILGFSGADLLAPRLAEPCLTGRHVAPVASRVARVDRLDMRLPIEARAQPSKPMANRHLLKSLKLHAVARKVLPQIREEQLRVPAA